jgi:hypothetical protein
MRARFGQGTELHMVAARTKSTFTRIKTYEVLRACPREFTGLDRTAQNVARLGWVVRKGK